jgi:hypothetical protein
MASVGANLGERTRPSHAYGASPSVGFAISLVRSEWGARRDNGWLGLVAVPLAMTATGVLGQWWSWPVLLAVSFCSTRAWRWSWVLSLEMAWVGTAWAVLGAWWLTAYPAERLLTGTAWTMFPAMLALMSFEHRRRMGGPEFQRLW